MARLIRPAGLVEYDAANAEMHTLAERRLAGDAADTLILLEHPPVYTAGRRWQPDHIVWTEERIAAAGAEQVVLVTSLPPQGRPHELSAERGDLCGHAAESLAAFEAAVVRDALERRPPRNLWLDL